MAPPPPLQDELLRQAGWTRRLARGLLGDESAAEDTLQETWESANRRPPHADRPIEPWLRRTIRNRLLNRAREAQRRDAREQKTIPGATPDSPEQLLARLEIHKKLVEAVSRLPEPYRQMVLLRYFEDQTSTEIGARLDLPAATVRGRLKTAVELLREELDRGPGGRRAWMGVVVLLTGRGGQLGPEPVVSVVKVVTQSLVVKVALVMTVLATITVSIHVATTPGPAPLSEPQARSPAVPPRFDRTVNRSIVNAPAASAAPVPAMAGLVSPGSGAAPVGTAAVSAISGQVWLGASVPPRTPLDMTGDPFCARQPRTEDETILADGDRGLANVVVRIVSRTPPPEPAPSRPVVLEASGCLYRPRLVVAQAGQAVELRNADEVVHSVHVRSDDGTDEVRPLARGDWPLWVSAPGAGRALRVTCDQHPWMSAIVLATDNPFFAITDRHGRYFLSGMAPGTYTVELWHEVLGVKRMEVTVRPGVAEVANTVLGGSYEPAVVNGDRCQLALRNDNPVVNACREGGIKKAKAVMKAMQKRGKEKGLKFECDDCHKDEAAGNWTLNKDAEEKFKRLLAAVRDARDRPAPP